MSGNGYRMLGFLVWHGGRWYVRRRLPAPSRALLGGGALAGAAVLTAVVAARRSGS